MKKDILKAQLKYTVLALAGWQKHVKPEAVSPELANWECGTQACFGGHLPHLPGFEFLSTTDSGVPRLHRGNIPADLKDLAGSCQAELYPAGVAGLLFGDAKLFGVTSLQEDETAQSDHEIVVQRLKANIERLQAKLGAEQ